MSTCQNKLVVKDVSKKYLNELILKDISFDAKENEFVSIVGPSGCGKSTLFNILSGLLTPLSGTIELDGENINGVTGKLGYMHQKDLLIPWRNVIDNVILPLELQGVKKQDSYKKAKELIQLFGLEGHEEKYPSQLSGGMRQRASLMRAYMLSKDVMLLDEPFGGLDAITKANMQEYLLHILEKMNRTILFITHDIEEAIFLSDKVIILGKDPAMILEVIDIDLPRPRNRDMVLTSEFLALKKRILKLL
jgi:ABC-type nitrate/sulfonate/bicarbonate transport system ATPase subunit